MDLAWERHEAWKEGIEKGKKQGKLIVADVFAQKLENKGYSKKDIRKQLNDYFSEQLSPNEIDQVISKL